MAIYEDGWQCVCGKANDASAAFCGKCGNQKPEDGHLQYAQ